MTIDLYQAIKLIQNSAGLLVDDYQLVFGEVRDDEDEDIFLVIDPEDGEPMHFHVTHNQKVELFGSSIFLIEGDRDDPEGEKVQITLLKPWEVEREDLA